MASTPKRPSSNGFSSADRSNDRPQDEGQSQEISVPLSPRSSLEFKSPDRSWDAMSGGLDSPRSSISASSIESPSSSNLTKSLSGKMKPRRSQSSYYDEETGTWKCRNCGGTYDMPNPGSRQRREHKKACEETQRMQAIKRAEEEQARREDAAREAERLAALRAQGFPEEANRQHEILVRGRDAENRLQSGPGSSGRKAIGDDPSIMGAFITTPDIPEREEVNFEAPKELIHNIERDSEGHLRETQTVDAQSSKSNGADRRQGHDGADLDRINRATMDGFRGRDLSAADQGQGDKAGSPLKFEVSGEIRPANGSSTPPSNRGLDRHWIDEASPLQADQSPGGKAGSPLRIELSGLELLSANGPSTPTVSSEVHQHGSLDHHWIDKGSPSPQSGPSNALEQVKHCSAPSVASNGALLGGTVYDRLVDLHDDPQVVVAQTASMDRHAGPATTRTASMDRHGSSLQTARIGSTNPEIDTIALGAHSSKASHEDRFGVRVTLNPNPRTRAAQLAEHSTATATAKWEDASSRDNSSPEDLIEALILGRNNNPGTPPGLNHGADEIRQVHSPGHSSTAAAAAGRPSIASSRRTPLDTAAGSSAVRRRRTQLDSARAAAAASRSSREQSAGNDGDERRGASHPCSRNEQSGDPPEEDENIGAMLARTVRKHWKLAASVGAVAVMAWVGKSLGNRQQEPRRQAPGCRRNHYPAVVRYYWEEEGY